jgi:hypothetical protein
MGDYMGLAEAGNNFGALWAMPHNNPDGTIDHDSIFFRSASAGDAPSIVTMSQGTVQLTINDVTLAEGDSGMTQFVFTVTLSTPTTQPVIVSFTTADGTATGGQDYVASSGTLTFAGGQTTQTITVLVKADKIKESDETFFVNLSGAVDAQILDSQGLGIILSDDGH